MQLPGALRGYGSCVMEVMPALITFQIPTCARSSPYTMRLGLINILIIKRILPRMCDELFQQQTKVQEGESPLRICASRHRSPMFLGDFLLGAIF